MSELASKHNKAMTAEAQQSNQDHEQVVIISQKKMTKRRQCAISIGLLLLLLMVLVIVFVVLALTLFKPKEPRTKLVSATLEGISPRVTLPAIDIQLNVTIDLKILVENRNHASFKHDQGKSILLYKGIEVGETDIYPGFIPSRGSETLPSRLTLEADKIASSLNSFIGDIVGGQVTMETVTRIRGRVTFLGFIKKHIVAKSNCRFTIGFPDFKIKSQVCKAKI